MLEYFKLTDDSAVRIVVVVFIYSHTAYLFMQTLCILHSI